MLARFKRHKLELIAIVFFVVLSIWWVTIYARGLRDSTENNLFTLTYFWISLLGGVVGLINAKRWGGFKSILGKSFIAFSLGLLGQTFGQICYSFYIYVLQVEVPYPSIGDFGFFATGILYAYGSLQLMRAAGARFSVRSYSGKAVALIIPILWALFSYYFFLNGYEFDWSSPFTIVLDLVSPIIDGVYLSLAILTYLLSKKFLGGIMKKPILLLLVAIVLEAANDYFFIYQTSRETWYVGGINDYFYLLAYTVMTIALMQLGASFKKINEA